MGCSQYICLACGGSEDNCGYEEECVCIVRLVQPWYKGAEIKTGDVIEGKYSGYGWVDHGAFKLICNGLVGYGQFDEKDIADMKGVLVDMYCKSCYEAAGMDTIKSMLREINDQVDHIKGVMQAMDSKGVKRKMAAPEPERATKKSKLNK